MHTWGQANLGANAPATANPASMLVLLVRGDVIRRYPNVLVYATNAAGGLPANGTELFPFFTGRLTADVAFYGFTIDPATANGRFFVLQEQPSEPRFDPPNENDTYTPASPSTSSAAFAIARFQRLTRVAILGSGLTPPQS
jgi:hypothetical protein